LDGPIGDGENLAGSEDPVVSFRYGSGATVAGGVECTGSDGVGTVASDLGDAAFFYDCGVDDNTDAGFLVRAGEDQFLGALFGRFAGEAGGVKSRDEFDSEDLTVGFDVGIVGHCDLPLMIRI
jgi:hypothetical protein